MSAPGIGHNRPKPDLGSPEADWLEYLGGEFAALQAERDALLERFDRFKARYADVSKWDDSVAGAVSDFRNALRDLIKRADALHTLQKSPVLALGKLVDGYRAKFLAAVVSLDSKRQLVKGDGAALNVVVERATQYLQRKEAAERQAREKAAAEAKAEADRKMEAAARAMTTEALGTAADAAAQAAEAQEAAAAPPAELSRVRGDLGGVMSLRRRWEFVEAESDLGKLVVAVATGRADIRYLSFNSEAIGRAVRSEGLRELPGCVIKETTRA